MSKARSEMAATVRFPSTNQIAGFFRQRSGLESRSIPFSSLINITDPNVRLHSHQE